MNKPTDTSKRYPSNVNTLGVNSLQEGLQTADKFVSIGKAAELLGVSIQTIRRWDRSGKISSIRSPGGHRYFHRRDLKKLFDKKTSNLKIVTEHKASTGRKNKNNKTKSFSVRKIFLFLLIFFVSMDFILVLFYFFARNSTLPIPYL